MYHKKTKCLNILDLPDEIFFYYIFPNILNNTNDNFISYGDYTYMVTLKYVCKKFYHLIRTRSFWNQFLKKEGLEFIHNQLSNKTEQELINFDYCIWSIKNMYKSYCLKREYDNKIINLFESFEQFYNLPNMNLSDVIYTYPKTALHDIFFYRQYIDYIEPHHLPFSIIRGKDIFDRPVICIKYLNRETNKEYVDTIFKRYCELTRRFVWTCGSSYGDSIILNSGNTYVLNVTSLNYLKRLINNKKCGKILLDSISKKYYEEENYYYPDNLGTIVIVKE